MVSTSSHVASSATLLFHREGKPTAIIIKGQSREKVVMPIAATRIDSLKIEKLGIAASSKTHHLSKTHGYRKRQNGEPNIANASLARLDVSWKVSLPNQTRTLELSYLMSTVDSP
jgi:hypothetical protein